MARRTSSSGKRQPGTLLLDPSGTVNHLLLRRDYVGVADVDRLVAEFIRRSQSAAGVKRRPVLLWRGQFDTAGEDSWPYWSLAIDASRLAWYEDLRAAADALELMPAMGQSSPAGSHGIGAQPYIRIEGRSIAVFDQRRRPHTRTTLVLGDDAFEATTLRYRYPAPPEETRPQPRDPNDLAARISGLARLAAVHRVSPLALWPQASESLIELSHSTESSSLSCADAVELSETFGIPVVELEMAEYGRLVVEPVWGVSGDASWVDDCRVTIAIRADLPEPQRRLALFHELGHYAHHLRYLVNFLLLQFRLAQDAQLEAKVAARFPAEWQRTRNRIMELDADFFSSAFVVPHFATGWLRDGGSSFDPAHVKGSILLWLHNVFDDGWSWGRVESSVFEAAWRDAAALTYNPTAPWFDRLVSCVVMRTNETLVDAVRGSVQLDDDMHIMESALSDPQGWSPDISSGEAHLIARCSPADIDRIFSSPGRWDPVIVEPRNGDKATGYLPLRPMFTRGASVDTYDWTRADAWGRGQAGTIDEWWPVAEASGRGLMLMPMHPVQHALQQQYS